MGRESPALAVSLHPFFEVRENIFYLLQRRPQVVRDLLGDDLERW